MRGPERKGGEAPSSKDEALARYSVSREVPRSVLKSEKLLETLDATPIVPRKNLERVQRTSENKLLHWF